MDNFDLKKYLVENKITSNSRLNEIFGFNKKDNESIDLSKPLEIEPYKEGNPEGIYKFKVLYSEKDSTTPKYQSLHKYLPPPSTAYILLAKKDLLGTDFSNNKAKDKVKPFKIIDQSGKEIKFKDENDNEFLNQMKKAGWVKSPELGWQAG
jgi:hypothetical protein